MKYYIVLILTIMSLLSFGNNSLISASSMPLPPPPTNDGPCSAIVLPVDTFCNSQTFTNVDATNSSVANPSCTWATIGNDVWFQVTVPTTGALVIEVNSVVTTNMGLAIYSGVDCNNLTEEYCATTWSMPFQNVINQSSGLGGQTVWIRLWIEDPDPFFNIPGDFDICAYTRNIIDVNTDLYTPQELVEDVLVTGCLQAMNTQFYGPDSAIGYFTDGDITGFSSGLVLACGSVNDINNSNTMGISVLEALGYVNPQTTIVNDLLAVANNNAMGTTITSLNDVIILEFDFIPSSNTTLFDFVFASVEYQGFECTEFNDAFAFFLSGPGISGPYTDNAINIALVPGTTDAITISSINGPPALTSGSCTSTHNPQYYVNNIIGPTFNVNGYTVPLTAVMADLTPCETYHIRFVIGDAGDEILTSYVFFNQGSFSSGGDIVMSNFSNVGTIHDIYEGCENYYVFERVDTSAAAMLDTVFIDLTLDGTAVNGVDYTTSSTNLMILPGEYTDTLFYDGLWDNVQETNEYIIFSILNGCPCTPSSTSDTIWILDNFELNPIISPDTTICVGFSVDLDVTINPLQDQSIVSYLWDDGSTGTNISVTPSSTETHWVQVSTPCQQDTTVSMTITVAPPPTTTFTVSKDTICIDEDLLITYVGSAGPSTDYLWDFDSGTPSSALTIGPHTVNWSSSGNKTITLNIDDTGCINDTSLSIFVSPNPVIDITPTNNLCFGDCNGELLATPQDNYEPYTYSWSNSQSINPATSLCAGQYDVTFQNRFGCESTSTEQITEPSQLSISITEIDVSCFGNNDGQATAVAQNGTPPYSFVWEGPSSYNGNTANITDLFFGQYNVTATDANNCVVTGSIYVNQPDSPLTSNISGENSLCFGSPMGNIYIEPTGGTPTYTYIWSNGSTNQNLINVLAGQYDVTLTDINGCVGYNSISIGEPTQVVNNSITTTPVSCFGYSDGSATIQVSGGTPPYTYSWTHNVSNSETADLVPAGTYMVTVLDDNDCPLIINGINVASPNQLVVEIQDVPKICIGQDVDLFSTVSGGITPYQYIWDNSNVSSQINVSPVSLTTYYLTVTDVNNCVASTNIDVDVYPAITADITANITQICPGDPVLITVSAIGGNGNYIYTNQYDGVISNPQIIYPEASLTYVVTVSDDCGSPTDDASVDITVLDKPPLSFISNVKNGCQPLKVHFIEQSPEIGQTYVWDFGDTDPSNIGTDKEPIHIYYDWGVFDVSLEVTSAEGCKNSFTFDNMIEVYKLPKAKFIANPDLVDILKPEVYFENLSEDNYNNYWWFGDGENSFLENPTHIYGDFPNDYTIKLIVETEHGCLDTVLSQVKVENVITIYVPTAFSPDGDGINDKFIVVGNGIDLDNYMIYIYDRWGELIYLNDDLSEAWDGTVKGQLVQQGVYKWLVVYKDERGVEYQKTGTVTLIR